GACRRRGRQRAAALPCAPRRGRASSPSRAGGRSGTPPGSSRLPEVLPALAEGASGHRRQVARTRPLAEEKRQSPQPAIADEWPLGEPAEAGPPPEGSRGGPG